MYKAIKTKLSLTKNERQFLLHQTHIAKNLYNEALYNIRQYFFYTGNYLTYNDNQFKLSRESDNYRLLNTSLAQSIIKKVDEAMKAFFGSLRSNNSKKVRLPRYLEKHGHYSLIDRMVYKPNKEYYVLPRGNFIKRVSKFFESDSKYLRKYNLTRLDVITSLGIRIKTPKCIQDKEIKEITIKPKYDGKYIEVVYTYIDNEVMKTSSKKSEKMGIDFGYNNLAYCAVTNGNHLHIDGLRLKSMNQRYHKVISKLASTRPNQKILTKRMVRTIEKRNNQMTYGLNKAAKLIVEHAINNDVGKIVIGYNDSFKDINTSKKNNQWFNTIPIARLRDRIIYLSELYGIETKVVNEAYSSKASYIDNDIMPEKYKKETSFSGKRTKRGLYVSKAGIAINADLNAALNILRKCNPESIKIGSIGLNTPKRTYLFLS
jgi:IS605 OrfB family transposase